MKCDELRPVFVDANHCIVANDLGELYYKPEVDAAIAELKAGNYRLEETLKADFYVLPDGERVHPVTMWHRHRTRVMDVLQKIYPGIKKAEGYQLKFVKDL